MNNKETENLISDMLNLQKPDKNVLSSAKSVMAKNKPIQLRIKRQFYALSGCAAVFIIVGVIFAVLNQIYNNNYEGHTLSSVNESAFEFGHSFLIIAITLISTGVLLAITAMIIRVKKNVRVNKL